MGSRDVIELRNYLGHGDRRTAAPRTRNDSDESGVKHIIEDMCGIRPIFLNRKIPQLRESGLMRIVNRSSIFGTFSPSQEPSDLQVRL